MSVSYGNAHLKILELELKWPEMALAKFYHMLVYLCSVV